MLILTVSAVARLGETVEQCNTRYGKPTETDAVGRVVYLKSGILITILFINGRADYLGFMKFYDGGPFVEEEWLKILDANSAFGKWEPKPQDDYRDRLWTAKRGAIVARLKNLNLLYIGTATAEVQWNALEKKDNEIFWEKKRRQVRQKLDGL
jgi:hypothetical protein